MLCKSSALVVAHAHTGIGFQILDGEHEGAVFCADADAPVEIGETVRVTFAPDDQYARLDASTDPDDEIVCDKRDERGYICSSAEHGSDDCCDYYNEHGRHATRAELAPRPLNAYEQKQEDRRERYLERAQKARGESKRAYQAARSILNVIPMGQPVLVGHHSEKRHRRDLERVDSSMRKSIDADNRAGYYEHRAESVGRAGISQDDPDAIPKLREKLAGLQAARETEKQANAAIRRAAKAFAKREGREPTQRDHLALLDDLVKADKMAEPIAEGLRRYARAFPWLPQYGNGNAAEIRRTEKRIAEIEAKAAAPDREPLRGRVDGVSYTIEWNKADNRVQIYFPTRPSDAVVERLKFRGFRWARSVAAWQRHASEGAWYHAQQVVHHEQNRDITTDEMDDDDDGSCGSAVVTYAPGGQS